VQEFTPMSTLYSAPHVCKETHTFLDRDFLQELTILMYCSVPLSFIVTELSLCCLINHLQTVFKIMATLLSFIWNLWILWWWPSLAIRVYCRSSTIFNKYALI
jgi:hypothetical protein